MRTARMRTEGSAASRSARPSASSPEPPPPPRGVSGAVRVLTERKLRELHGRRWEGASDVQRRREAEKRARQEMARRIAEETARSMSAATVQRHARAGTVPAGVDLGRIERQAVIDMAGGIRQLAQARGITEYRVRKWRDEGGELPAELSTPMSITGTVGGTLWSNGKPYPDRVVKVNLWLDAEDALLVRRALRAGDTDALLEELDRHITEQVDWSGAGDRRFETHVFDDLVYEDE